MSKNPRSFNDPIALGQQQLHEVGKPFDEIAINQQINLACEPWTEALRSLNDYPDVVLILEALYPDVLPFLIKGNEVSPVHHIAYVVSFMAQIAVGEKLAPHDVKRCCLAALFHDIGIGDSTRPKISERQIRTETDPAKKAHLIREGIASRCEHMEKGVVIARDLLQAYRRKRPSMLSDEDVAVILNIVGTHDNGKIPLMEETVNPQWLLRSGPEDWLKQCHWEADALWMLCPAGLLVDLQRSKKDDTPANRKEQFHFNLGLHADIVTKYKEGLPKKEFAKFGFKKGLLYRTETGYDLMKQFKRLVKGL